MKASRQAFAGQAISCSQRFLATRSLAGQDAFTRVRNVHKKAGSVLKCVSERRSIENKSARKVGKSRENNKRG